MIAREGYQFVDTNILLYAHDVTSAAKYQRSLALIDELWTLRSGCVSVQVLQEFYVNVTRKVQPPLSPEEAVESVAEFAQWRVHAPDGSDVLGAIAIHQRYDISFWDAMVIRSAERLGCNVIWSEDLNPGQRYVGVRVANPFAE